MAIFVVLGLMAAAARALLVLPRLRRRGEAAPREAYDLRFYRDQLRELDREVDRGVIEPAQQATARAEIAWRASSARRLRQSQSLSPPWATDSAVRNSSRRMHGATMITSSVCLTSCATRA